ncbi:MAG TPA: FHA domain-containing protein [Pyrinomonadaceae bacterium]
MPRPARRILTATLLTVAALAAWPGAARAQGDSLQALEEEYKRLEREGLEENYIRHLSYTMLQKYLPPGTRFTSGYRSPQKQLDLIVRNARARGISVPASVTLEDESSWRPTLMALRSTGFIVAAPTTTPHGTEEAVFDLSGPNLNAIQSGLLKAQDAGMIKYKRIIFETNNNAVHVEVESISPKLLNELKKASSLGRSSGSSSAPAPGGPATTTPSSEDEQKRGMIAQLRGLHEAEPDPDKRIDYDRSTISLLDSTSDSARIGELEEEIKRHTEEARSLGASSEQREAVEKISEALRDDRLKDAEREAASLVKRFPDFPDARRMFVEIRTRRILVEATRAMEAASCGDCERAAALVERALELAPGHEGARLIKEDVDACTERCGKRSVALWAVSLLLLASLGGGLYFLAISKNWLPSKTTAASAPSGWVLEVIEGVERGRVFSLDKETIVVGSKGPPDGEADVVVTDARRRVSRRHCTLLRESGRLYVRDESTNGTKVNGRDAGRGVLTQCRAGDSLTLGDAAVLLLKQG